MGSSLRVSIRLCRAGDLPALEAGLPGPPGSRPHERRFGEQTTGVSAYLVAWAGGRAVGHLNLRWRGPDEPDARARIGALPVHTALAVAEDVRRRGTGAELIRSAEALATERGHTGACLAVALDNPDARRLFERLGYRDCEAGVMESAWPSADAGGRPTVHVERVVYLARHWGPPRYAFPEGMFGGWCPPRSSKPSAGRC